MDGFASIASLLTTLTQNSTKFKWSEACEKSFQLLKDRLTSAPVLTLPEGTKGYVVYCDASRVGLWCVLKQHKKVIAYALVNLRYMSETIPLMTLIYRSWCFLKKFGGITYMVYMLMYLPTIRVFVFTQKELILRPKRWLEFFYRL